MASVLMLAACGETPPAQPDDEASVEASSEALSQDSLERETMAETATDEAIIIPARYQGVWDYEGGTCAPESDMRMEVTSTDITYYESYGRVTGTRPEGDDLIVDLAMEGEGQEWPESQRLSLVGNGTAERLHVTNGSEPKRADEYPRMSCS